MNSFGFANAAPLIPDRQDAPVAAVAVAAVPAAVKPKAPARRKRAHEKDGTFKADDPATPDHNEAWQAE